MLQAVKADLISWNRGWNSVYGYSKGKKIMGKPISYRGESYAGYTSQLKQFIRMSHQSESSKMSKISKREGEKLIEKIDDYTHGNNESNDIIFKLYSRPLDGDLVAIPHGPMSQNSQSISDKINRTKKQPERFVRTKNFKHEYLLFNLL